MNVQTATNI